MTITGDSLRIEYIPLGKVTRWDRNPKKHDLPALINSIKYYPDTEYLFKMSDKGSLFKTGIPKEDVSYGTYWVEEMGSGGHNHPTVKPLKPNSDQIQICTNVGELVADPFSGSGTTIIACENLSRRCRAVEIDAGYVGVALERWSTHTGQTPERLE